MRKKYLEPRMLVQIFDEETLTEEVWEDDTDVRSTLPEGGGSGSSGDDLFEGLM